jgi:peroxiredoxin
VFVSQLEDTITVTVQGNLDKLQAERNASWPADRLAAHEAFRLSLEETADRRAFVAPGDVVEPFTLLEVDGGVVSLDELLQSGPVVLIFFRFEGCPACNVALPAYRDALFPEAERLGAHLVAVSPQIPEKLRAIKERHGFEFLVAADPEATLLHAFGIAFGPDEEEQETRRRSGSDLGEVLGTGRWELPYPTVVVIDSNRVVRFADIHPNWMVRTEATAVVEAIRSIS